MSIGHCKGASPTDLFTRQLQGDLCVWAAGDVHNGTGERFVQRTQGKPPSSDARTTAQCSIERLTQRQRAVLSGVVVVHLQISLCNITFNQIPLQ